jgi:anti-anti-sigma factor
MSEPITRLTCPLVVLRLVVPELKDDEVADEVREQCLAQYQQTNALNVVLDFHDVTYLASAGFRPLLSLQRRVRERGGRLVLCNLDPKVEDVFSLTRLIATSSSSRATFEVQANVPAAVASLYRGMPSC